MREAARVEGVDSLQVCANLLRHPLLALERVSSVTKGQLILETHVDMLDCTRPAGAFYPDKELCGDPTNWFGPNPPAVPATCVPCSPQASGLGSGFGVALAGLLAS